MDPCASRASAFRYRAPGADPAEIGSALQVTTLLDGTVRRSGDRIRITTSQTLEGATDQALTNHCNTNYQREQPAHGCRLRDCNDETQNKNLRRMKDDTCCCPTQERVECTSN